MSPRSRKPKPYLKCGESGSPVEDWQLRILWEWQQKQPPSHPSLEQRRLLATQTGLNIKWISNWFKKVNGVSKKKVGAPGKGAFSGSPLVTAVTDGPGSPKLADLAEAIRPNPTGAPPSTAEVFYQSDVGVNATLEIVRSSVPHQKRSPARELSGAADLVLVPDADLQTNRDHLGLCSSSHGAHLVQVSESPSVLLHSLGHDLTSSLQHVNSPGGLLSGSTPPSSCGFHTQHESVQTRHFHATLCGSQSVVPAYPKYHTAHDSGSASASMLPDSSVPTSLPSLVPLPSIYWLLFDRDEHSSIGGCNCTLRGTPLSPPRGEPGGSGLAAASQASATPVSFLAKWEDILTLERSAHSSFVKNLSRAGEAQSPEVTHMEHGDLGTSRTLTGSGNDALTLTYPRRVQSSSSTAE